MKGMYKAVIFDFDGLILDTETLHVEIYQEMFNDKQRLNSMNDVSFHQLLEEMNLHLDEENI
jgi:beta-phosphoglucomutase-like phosphatase (HAD superfamily)